MSAPSRKWPLVVGIIALCALIAAIPLAVVSGSGFGGADGAAQELIAAIDPDYEPWASPVLEPPGSETESLIFCIQAAVGGGILGYGFGYYRARHRAQAQADRDPEDAGGGPSGEDPARG